MVCIKWCGLSLVSILGSHALPSGTGAPTGPRAAEDLRSVMIREEENGSIPISHSQLLAAPRSLLSSTAQISYRELA